MAKKGKAELITPVEGSRQNCCESGVCVVVGGEGEEDGGEGERAQVQRRRRHRLQREQLQGRDRGYQVKLSVQLLRGKYQQLGRYALVKYMLKLYHLDHRDFISESTVVYVPGL